MVADALVVSVPASLSRIARSYCNVASCGLVCGGDNPDSGAQCMLLRGSVAPPSPTPYDHPPAVEYAGARHIPCSAGNNTRNVVSLLLAPAESQMSAHCCCP
ncbi:hypothetical protein NDU88_000689 [Pleurodeles waltl]|uniref:Secreted protein n=1 Tax=Pleurodeles waltl TaxID=8319 RepID=A0AAV7RAS6_PLEWA|nr:hypothetical protein NDU88_000689 [Pleurodeles waltl]